MCVQHALCVYCAHSALSGFYYTPPPPPPPRTHGVSIPESRFHVPATDLVDLQQEVNPLAESKNYGIELYESVLNFLEQRRLT